MTWTPRSDWVNVKSAPYNATGNGTTDDTAAIQAAMNVLNNNIYGPLRTVYFPPGTYRISSTLSLANLQNFSVVGSGSNTIIKWYGATGGAMFHPNHIDGARYIGLVWDGNNIAGCAFEQWSNDGNYDGGIRHENESFRNFTQNGTYLPAGHAAVPGAAIAGGFNVNGTYSLEADSMIFNCCFSNCSTGYYNNLDIGNNMEWLIDSCEFDNCGIGVNFNYGGCNAVVNSHFQNSITADISGNFSTRIRHCTSTGSNAFLDEINNSYSQDVIEDCWIDSWKNASFAIGFGSLGGEMVFDCTFTNPPAGALGAIANYQGWEPTQQLILSNNYAPGFANGMGLINAGSNPIAPLLVPPGTRRGTLTSASQTFLSSAAFVDSTHIIDVTAAPYNANKNYSGDDSAAIQSAINAAITANNGSVVYFPAGIYQLYSTLNASGGNYTLQGCPIGSEFCWLGANSSTMLNITNPTSVTVDGLRFAALNDTITGIKQTATGASSIVYRQVSFNSFSTGNPGAGGPDISDAPGLVLSNLPANSTVYLDHVLVPLTVQNCGPAQILGRFLQNGAVNVSGTSPKTGFLGFQFSEGGNYANSAGFNLTVNDNQDFIISDDYTERAYNDLQLLRGAGTGTGRVTIQGFNVAPNSPETMVSVNNYAGLLFCAPQAYYNAGNVATITQTGSNPIDIVLADIYFGNGVPSITTGSGANVLMELNQNLTSNQSTYLPNSPSNPTGKNLLSFANGLDHVRQLGSLDLSTRFGIATDGPPLVSYAFENDVTDETGNYNATNHGATFGDGEVGAQAASLNGSNAYIDMNNPASLPSGRSARTIAGWGKTNSTAGGYRWIASYGSPSGDQAMFIGMNGSNLIAGGYGDDLQVNNFWDNNWHYIVLTYDGTTANLYADGVLVATGAKNWNLVKNYAYIGKQVNGAEYWNGCVDQVQIYGYALTASDVSYLYNHARVSTPLASSWKLDETASPSADSSGNGATGTWENGPTFTTDHPAVLTNDPGSLSFSAVAAQAVNMGNPRNLPFGYAARTICGWAKSNGLSGYGMFASFGTANTGQGMWIGANGTSLSAGSWGDDMPDIPNFWDGNWHYIVLTYDGTTASLYADGTLAESAAKSWNLRPNVCFVGCYLNHGAFWNGNVDDVRIYNRCLSAAEVAKLTGPVAYWKLDENSGSTSFDSSGNGINGACQNAPPFTSDHSSTIKFPDAGSLVFNGSNQFVNFGNPAALPSGTAPRTLCGWAKSNGAPGGWHWIAAFGSPNTSQAMFIGANGTTLYGGGYADDLAVNNFWDGNWHFIALTYDGTTANLFADGVLRATSTKTWNLVPSACYVGEQVNNAAEFWSGSIDDVRIYNRVLSSTEISRLAAGSP